MASIVTKDNELSIFEWSFGSLPISDMKNWIDDQIETGKNKIKVDLYLGHDDKIDGIKLVAE